ncbi:MAG TPA: hypothetical protein VFZ25_03325 [Chloroflexota bacterium]|nr:hypothetical protein [Chloroflexota bacterium]
MGVLTIIVAVLAIIDGLIHLSLDFAVRGNVFAKPGWGLLQVLFVLEFLAQVVLVGAMFASERASLLQQRIVGAALAVVPAVTFIAYLYVTKAKYNPLDLALIDKPLEIILVIVAAYRVFQLGQSAAAQTIVSPARG